MVSGGSESSRSESKPDPVVQMIRKTLFEETTPLRQTLLNELFMPLFGKRVVDTKRKMTPEYRKLKQQEKSYLKYIQEGGPEAEDAYRWPLSHVRREMQRLESQNAAYLDAEPVYEDVDTMDIGSIIPIIGTAEERGRQAASRTLRSTREDLARSGLAGTPFGANVLATTRRAGEFDVSQVAPNYAKTFLEQIPGFVSGAQQVQMSGVTPIQSSSSSGSSFGIGGNLGFTFS